MNDKIEVGEYVRTDKGYIAKLIERDIEDEDVKDGMLFDNYIYKEHKQMRESGIKKCCKKHSQNIIDLIEVGDYVNGYEVITVYGYDEDGNDKDGLGICEVDDDYAYYLYLEDIDIKSIVTKEQFVSIEYKVCK